MAGHEEAAVRDPRAKIDHKAIQIVAREGLRPREHCDRPKRHAGTGAEDRSGGEHEQRAQQERVHVGGAGMRRAIAKCKTGVRFPPLYCISQREDGFVPRCCVGSLADQYLGGPDMASTLLAGQQRMIARGSS